MGATQPKEALARILAAGHASADEVAARLGISDHIPLRAPDYLA